MGIGKATTHSVSEDAFSGQTVPFEEEGTEDVRAAVTAVSRQQYGTPKATVEAYLETLFATDETGGKGKSSTAKKKSTAKSKSTKTKNARKLYGG